MENKNESIPDDYYLLKKDGVICEYYDKDGVLIAKEFEEDFRYVSDKWYNNKNESIEESDLPFTV